MAMKYVVRIVITSILWSGSITGFAQQEAAETEQKVIPVKAGATDDAVRNRIRSILQASEWFHEISVQNNSGIVTLNGTTASGEHKDWAENIAYRTEDVVAVVNKIQVVNPDPWSLAPVADQTQALFQQGLRHVPQWIVSLLILAVSVLLARRLVATARRLLTKRVDSIMLRGLIARLVAIPVLVIGIYLVFSVSGLGSLATTLIGGTGLLGLIIGIAFRDITENFLASILLSIQRPFVLGDMIKVLDYTGMVEAMTTRGTVLITLDGNHVQIPNTIIYKEPITNLSANPNVRQSFTVGIGYDASISLVQGLVLAWLDEHPAVLKDPEPLILAEQLAPSTVNLGIYFWVNTRTHSILKVRSSVIRTVKSKLMDAGISMPDDAREIIFPQGIAVHMDEQESPPEAKSHPAASFKRVEKEERCLATPAEGQLTSEEGVLKQQARNGTLGENETNLLKP
jgi:small-conductance mechanosensitive channel